MTDDPWRIDAEAYVLGVLDDAERRAFEDHVRGCPGCRAAVEEVGSLPALLDQVPPALVEQLAAQDPVTADAVRPQPAPAPPSLLAGLLAAARRRAARRRRVLVGVLAAMAAAVVALVLVLPGSPVSVVPAPTPTVVHELTMRALVPGPVTASARLESVAWGTRVELTCTYAAPSAPGYGSGRGTAEGGDYTLVVVDRAGAAEQVASWTAVPGATITVPASSHLPVSDIAAVQLRAPDGTTVLTAST